MASTAAHGQAATYAFTGTVTGATGTYASVPLGTPVAGTFTIDLANAIASQSSSAVSLSASWTEQAYGGALYGLPPPGAYVVASSASSGAASYQTSPVPGAYQTLTAVETGAVAAGYASGYYSAVERVCPTSATCSSSELVIQSANANPWSSAGLPVFAAGATGNGYFSVPGASIAYSLGSLTLQSASGSGPSPAAGDGPLPLWALGALGAGIVGVARRRLRAHA
jgi:hypothetical protein